MQKFTGMTMVAAAVLALTTTAMAAERNQDAAMLEDERQEHAWMAHNAKGVDKTAHREEEHRVQELIDALQRGERVDAAEVDRLLNRTR
jgi:hypothetical protein